VSGVALAAVIVLAFFLAGIAVGIVAVFAMSPRRPGKPGEREPEERDWPGEQDWPDDEDDDFELHRPREDEPGAEPGQTPWWHARHDN
jgi:hypothetical protein